MDINEIQARAVGESNKICKSRNINPPDADSTLLHLMEEVGELSREIINERLRRKEFSLQKFGAELSDCIIMLMLLASKYDINLEEVLLDKIDKLKYKR